MVGTAQRTVHTAANHAKTRFATPTTIHSVSSAIIMALQLLSISTLLNVLLCYRSIYGQSYGYDAGSDQDACRRHYRAMRRFRPSCDLNSNGGFCLSAGPSYPWRAVKRFISENQGLVRRMYGEQNHEAVLKEQLSTSAASDYIDSADYPHPLDRQSRFFYRHLNPEINSVNSEARFLRDEDINNEDVLNTKFIYSDEPQISLKFSDLKLFKKTASKFYSTTPVTTTTTSTSSTLNELQSEESMTTDPLTNVPTLSMAPDNSTARDETTYATSTQQSTDYGDDTYMETINPSDRPNEDQNYGNVLFQDIEEQEKHLEKMNYNVEGVNACPVQEEVIAPFWANNTRGEILALLNMYPFEQYVHSEKCTHEHRQMFCRDGCKCEQQYRLHRLLAYDPNNECRGIFSDWFRFPSCCICKCYTLSTSDLRITSRSPRTLNQQQQQPPPT